MMPYVCDLFGYCRSGFVGLYAYIQHIQYHILKGDIKHNDYKKFNIYPSKIFQLDMRSVYILEEYYKGLYDPLIHMSDKHIAIYKREIDNLEEQNERN